MPRLHKLVPFIISAIFIYALVSYFRFDYGELLKTLRVMNMPLALLALLAYLAAEYVIAFRLKVIYKVFEISNTVFMFFLYTLIGIFVNNVIPTCIGGDLTKAYCAAPGGSDKMTQSVVASFADRLIGLAGMVLMGYMAIFLAPQFADMRQGAVVWSIPFVFMSGIAGMAILRSEAVRNMIRGIFARMPKIAALIDAVLTLATSVKALFVSLLLTFMTIGLLALSCWYAAQALHAPVEYTFLLFLVPVAAISVIMPSVNGIGVRETIFVFMLKGIMPVEKALALALVVYFLTVITGALGGITLLFRRRFGISFAFSSKIGG